MSVQEIYSQEVINIQPHTLIVPPAMAYDADKILCTHSTIISRIGNYKKVKEVYNGKYSNYIDRIKIYWARERHSLFYSKYKISSVVRKVFEPNKYVSIIKSCHLPKAMRKRGYTVEDEYKCEYMSGWYEIRILDPMGNVLCSYDY